MGARVVVQTLGQQAGSYWSEVPVLALGLPLWLGYWLLLALRTNCLILILVFPSDHEPNAHLWEESLRLQLHLLRKGRAETGRY